MNRPLEGYPSGIQHKGQVVKKAGPERLTLNMQSHRLIDRDNATKCYMKQAIREITVLSKNKYRHYEVKMVDKDRAKEELLNGHPKVDIFSLRTKMRADLNSVKDV